MQTRFRRRRPSFRRPAPLLGLEALEERALPDANTVGFVMTNLASDIKGLAAHLDADLINPWGFAETPSGQFQVSANGAGNSPRLNARGDELGQPIALPAPGGGGGTPNGAFFNTTGDFVLPQDGKPAQFIFSTEDGTILAFNPQLGSKTAVIANDQSGTGAVYKLLAEASVPGTGGGNFLYATDFHNNKIDVFDKNFQKVALNQGIWGSFQDPNEPAGFAPFGIKQINGLLFVTYAKQLGPDNHDDQEGPGNGFIDVFDTTGHFLQRFASGSAAGGTSPLNSPIGMAVAPPGFGPGGKFGGALLVGNFGDSTVSAFDLSHFDPKTPNSAPFLGQLTDAQGNVLHLNGGFQETNPKGLWGIAFGNGQGGTDPNTLYFAAGINAENDGLFGAVSQTDGDNDRDDHGPAGGGGGGNVRLSGLAAVEALFEKVVADVGQLAGQMAAFNASMPGPGQTPMGNAAFDQGLSQLLADETSLMATVRQTMIDQVMAGMNANTMVAMPRA